MCDHDSSDFFSPSDISKSSDPDFLNKASAIHCLGWSRNKYAPTQWQDEHGHPLISSAVEGWDPAGESGQSAAQCQILLDSLPDYTIRKRQGVNKISMHSSGLVSMEDTVLNYAIIKTAIIYQMNKKGLI